MNNIMGLIPVVLFLLLMLSISFYVRREAVRREGGFINEYFIGGRRLGGFVLAMTTVATYSSVSSFVGGPGQAWNIGYGWLYMAMVQVVVIFLVLGIFGKKMAIIARKINAITVIDVIRRRYQSDLLANLAACVIVIFFSATMVAQFVGGAKLFEVFTGYDYLIGLALFGLIVVLYTTVGGFRGVAITDTLCALAMIIGMLLLSVGVIKTGGGLAAIADTIKNTDSAMLEPLSDGKMPYTLYFTQWLLVGVCTIALPQSVVRSLSYKDTKSLHRAMIIGTVVIAVVTFGMHWVGILTKGFMTAPVETYGGTIDNIIPYAIAHTMHPVLAGITIIGPIAATISTVSSLLIAASSAIIKDVCLNIAEKQQKEYSDKTLAVASMGLTIILGLLVFWIAIEPPSVIWKINMFAFGGLEAAFFWILLFGLFWSKSNKTGAICSLSGGVATYCITMALGYKFLSMHQIVLAIIVALVCFLVGNALGKPHDEDTQRLFFPEKF